MVGSHGAHFHVFTKVELSQIDMVCEHIIKQMSKGNEINSKKNEKEKQECGSLASPIRKQAVEPPFITWPGGSDRI